MGVIVNIFYNNNNVTKDLAPYLLSLEYNNSINIGELAQYDDLMIVLDNKNNNFTNQDYPIKGSLLAIEIQDEFGGVGKYGGFYVDQITARKGKKTGSIVTINASTYNRKNDASSKKVKQYYGETFRQALKQIAANSKLKLVLDNDFKDFNLPVTILQWEITDFEFLFRLGRIYGFTVGVREGNLFVLSIDSLESKNTLGTVDIQNLEQLNFLLDSEFTDDVSFEHKYLKIQIQGYNGATASIKINEAFPNAKNDTTIVMGTTVQDRATQLEINAMNSERLRFVVRGVLTMKGILFCAIAGNTFEIINNGKFNGKYMIKSCSNKIDKKGGFIQTLQVYKTINQQL